LLYIHRDHRILKIFSFFYRDHNNYKGRGAQDVHLDFHTAPELWQSFLNMVHTEIIRLIRDGKMECKGYGGRERGVERTQLSGR